MAKAINEGLRAAMVGNNKVMMMGEDIAQLGGVFRVTEGLQEQFGPNRVVDTPLAESGIVGTTPSALRCGDIVRSVRFNSTDLFILLSTRSSAS